MRKKSFSDALFSLRARVPWLSARESAGARRPPKNLSMLLREWHKRIGLAACIFMLWLGASGVLLNQSPAWGLDAKRIDWPWLMSMYGLRAEAPRSGFASGTHWLAMANDSVVLDGTVFDTTLRAPIGMTESGSGGTRQLYMASQQELVIATPAGKRIDELTSATLPVRSIQRIGVTRDGGGVVIQGGDAFVSVDGGLSWKPSPTAGVQWSEPDDLNPAQRSIVLRFARPSVPLEQILIDLHSGRLFGHYGEYVIDVVGIAAVLLAISGVWIVVRANRRRAPMR